mgnify:CR=1 FL=1
MKVALIPFCAPRNAQASSVLKILESSSSARGNTVDVFNGFQDILNPRLTMYDYIAVLVQAKGLVVGQIPPRVAEFLSTSGTVSGKKGCALVLKSGFASGKTCRTLMRAMEKEGVMLDYFDVIKDADHARSVGGKIG